MRRGQIKPNEFELAILERLASKEPSVRGSVGQLHVLSRKFTGVGSFTTFACEELPADASREPINLDDAIINARRAERDGSRALLQGRYAALPGGLHVWR